MVAKTLDFLCGPFNSRCFGADEETLPGTKEFVDLLRSCKILEESGQDIV